MDKDTGINEALARLMPQVIVTFGVMADFKELNAAPLDIRLRWIHFDDAAKPPLELAAGIMECYLSYATRQRSPKSRWCRCSPPRIAPVSASCVCTAP